MALDLDFKHDHIRTLIVEHEDNHIEILSKHLTDAGFRKNNVLIATTYEDALACAVKEKIHVALIDYDLIPRTGFELMEELERMGNPVPVIMTAEIKDTNIDKGAMSRGAYDYLVKSAIDPELLERTIRYTVIRRKLEDELVHAALFDELSKLPNRRAFFDRLTQALHRADRRKQEVCLIYIDLNGFKSVNDTYGHQAGDEIIREVGRRLKQCLRRTDTPARLGGDEFACILEDFRDRDAAMQVINKVARTFDKKISFEGHRHDIGVSLGVSIYPESTRSIEVMIQLADEAMYQAKIKSRRAGQSKTVFASPDEKAA